MTRTLCEHFQATVVARGSAPALSMAGHPGLTWREYGEQVRRLAPGFAAFGAREGAMVPLLMGPRPEFHVADTALLHAGATPYSLHVGEPVEASVRAVTLTGATLLVTETAHLDAARAVAAATGVQLVCVDGRPDGTIGFDDLAGRRAPGFDTLWPAVGAEDIATLIFTSGTTGLPKAVRLSHRAIVTSELSTHALAPFGDPDGSVLSYLPLSHIAERFMSHYAQLVFGVGIRSVPDPEALYDELRELRPVRFFGVPRVYEKLLDRADSTMTPDQAEALAANVATVREVPTGGALSQAQVAPLEPVRRALGLDRAEYVGVATAPSAYDTMARLLGLGLRLSDIWGMSEAIMCTLNPPGAIRLGTVGVFLDGVEGRIADDGEILVRGPNTFSGYVGDPERTAELVDAEGWVHTGDVGSIDDGYLTIRGRKKELLITATGKNIAPAHIEGALKSASPLVDHVAAVADGRRYVTALVALDPDQLTAYAARLGHAGDFATLAALPEVVAEVERAVRAGNAGLAKAESVRGFVIADRPWLPGGEEVTPTSKLRRDVVTRLYAEEIEALYRS